MKKTTNNIWLDYSKKTFSLVEMVNIIDQSKETSIRNVCEPKIKQLGLNLDLGRYKDETKLFGSSLYKITNKSGNVYYVNFNLSRSLCLDITEIGNINDNEQQLTLKSQIECHENKDEGVDFKQWLMELCRLRELLSSSYFYTISQ